MSFTQLIPTVRYISKINGGKPMEISFSPILHACCHLFLGLPPPPVGRGRYFVIYLMSCPIKSLPLRHGQSALMSASFLCVERTIDRMRPGKIDTGLSK